MLRVQQLCGQLDKAASLGEPIDLQEYIGWLVFDIMTDLAWGGGGDAILKGRDPDAAIAGLRYTLHLGGDPASHIFPNVYLICCARYDEGYPMVCTHGPETTVDGQKEAKISRLR